ncbi:hypothetical protein V1506DRAFT_112168 [Lipomyces tetrasporus]
MLVRSFCDICIARAHKSPTDIARFFMSILIGSKSNPVPGAFWVLSNLVADIELKAEIEGFIAKNYIMTLAGNLTLRITTICNRYEIALVPFGTFS